MPDVLVKERTCDTCGADVRPESLYCHNCGEEVDDPPGVDRPIERPDLAADDKPILIPNITSKDSSPVIHEPKRAPATQVNGQPLESAAGLRQRSRSMERKPVEVIWEPTEGPNILLIVSTIVLLIFSAVVIALALYYR